MRTLFIYCKRCGTSVAGPLAEIPEENLRMGDQQNALEKGQFSVLRQNKKPELLISLDEGHLLDHKDSRRFSGCCGSGGMDGLNKLCGNGHEVATEFSDCYMPHCIVFDTNKITVKEKISDTDYKTIMIL